MDPLAAELEIIEAVALTVVVLALGGVAWLMTSSLLKTAKLGVAPGVTVALALLTFVAIIAAAVTRSDAMVALAGTGLGALAGAVTSVYRQDAPHTPPEAEEEEERNDDST